MEQDEPVCEMVTERRCNGVNGNIVIIVATTLHGGGGGLLKCYIQCWTFPVSIRILHTENQSVSSIISAQLGPGFTLMKRENCF